MTRTRGLVLLKKWLEEHPEYSQGWLANELGISQPSVSAWVRGTSRPEEHLRDALRMLTGIPVDAWRTAVESRQVTRIRERCRARELQATGTDGR